MDDVLDAVAGILSDVQPAAPVTAAPVLTRETLQAAIDAIRTQRRPSAGLA